MKKTQILQVILSFFLLLQIGCTEPFEIETIDFENVLVVEATITNESRHQQVKVSRTSTLENPGGQVENNAEVWIEANNGDMYQFSQDPETGDYISNTVFAVEANVEYTLKINSSDGLNYTSEAVILPETVAIENVYPEVITKDGVEGVQVFVDAFDATGNAKYFRYEYIETYKIVAPNPTSFIAEIINYNSQSETFDVQLTPREPEIVCYSTEFSTGIRQTATNELDENRVERFPVRFLDKNNAVLRERYSILVKQFVQSVEAYTFYKIINELGNVESLLSQGQPGYVSGNITSVGNPNEKVLGFFEAASVSMQRIYFNHEDLGLPVPPYFIDCNVIEIDYNDNTTLDNDPNEREILKTHIQYFDYQVIFAFHPNYLIVQPECSLCTYFSSNVRPDFWED
ncbi:DUF4249 domain-containing protein [Ulvibacter antarcticus]|uniref:Uncharacterized protein DUF4249 n=1 Tax=Ulvibacter antarcticus TaxID=442714 RepID=A0A3L9Z2I7_9FLAO|nr:DUF4249 domain-containing protein [Ulvibacter antarcticus]RMA64558.1 uncharacterized protein DUF4249 [Ulvibacter antarcticus]